MTSSVEQVGAPLVDVAQQPGSLAAAVAAGELWMEAGVAERAAARCDQAVDEINDLLRRADVLAWERKFGANLDGGAAATRFAEAGRDFIDTITNARGVFENMAATYRAAGRTVTEADAASEQMFRRRSE
ncbi:MAG: hypothetical protein WBF75_19760 [Pseudonocardiaceae bacterium]